MVFEGLKVLKEAILLLLSKYPGIMLSLFLLLLLLLLLFYYCSAFEYIINK